MWGGLKNLYEDATKKLEKGVDTVLNKIDGVEYRQTQEPV